MKMVTEISAPPVLDAFQDGTQTWKMIGTAAGSGSSVPTSNRKALVLLLVIVLTTMAAYAATMRGGMNWQADDQGMYLMHAQNILAGHPYAQTNYVFNPDTSLVGPRLYPPVWPALLAIPLALHDGNIEVVKYYMILLFGGILILTYMLARPRLDAKTALLPVIGLAISPWLWQYKENLLSELPFLFFTLAALVTLENIDARRRSREARMVWGVVAGLLIALACGTRSVGIVLMPTLVFYDLVKFRRLRLNTLWILMVSAIGIGLLMSSGNFFGAYDNLISSATNGAAASHGRLMHTILNMPANFAEFFVSLTALWALGPSNPFILAMGVFILGVMIIGAVRSVLEHFSVSEAFVLGYFSLILILPFGAGPRLVMPFMPLAAIYAVYAFCGTNIQAFDQFKRTGMIGLCTFFALSAIISHGNLSHKPFTDGPLSPDAQAMSAAVGKLISKGGTVVFRRARLLAYFSGRPTLRLALNQSRQKYLQDMARFHVSLVVMDHKSDPALLATIEACPRVFEPTARYSEYHLYRVHSAAACPAAQTR